MSRGSVSWSAEEFGVGLEGEGAVGVRWVAILGASALLGKTVAWAEAVCRFGSSGSYSKASATACRGAEEGTVAGVGIGAQPGSGAGVQVDGSRVPSWGASAFEGGAKGEVGEARGLDLGSGRGLSSWGYISVSGGVRQARVVDSRLRTIYQTSSCCSAA